MASTWQDIAIVTREHRDASIAKVQPPLPAINFEIPQNITSIPRQILTERECEITELSVEDLSLQIRSGKLSALETVQAFLRRAALAQSLV
jgi:amidase